jgi:signal transduction histidine kinase
VASVTGSGDQVRRRLLVVLLVFAAVAVTGFAWPLLSSTAEERTQRLLIDRNAALDHFAVLAQQAATSGDTAALTDEATAYATLYQEGVLILDEHRRVIVAAGDINPHDAHLRPLIDGALRNEPGQSLPPLRPWSASEIVLTRTVGTGPRITGVVALRISAAAAADDLARRWLLILLGAAAAAAGFVLLAMVLARWVLRPLAQLERGVLAIAAGRQGTHVPSGGGPPELRALTASFNRMSDAVAAAADKERQLVADASHQLRNPMAALRLRVDSLAPSVAATAQAGYRSLAAEVERLESLLDGLLALASADCAATHREPDDHAWCWPGAVVAARLDAWQPSACEADMRLVNKLSVEPAAVTCAESELAQVLDVLLDNAIRYAGSGAIVTLRVVEDPGVVRLIVEDNGPGLSAGERARATRRFWRAAKDGHGTGTGLGLAIAERLLAARAGTLQIRPNDP